MPRGRNNDGSPNAGWFRNGVALERTESHRKAISEAQRRSWKNGRKNGGERPVGTRYVDVNGYVRVKVREGAGRWAIEHVMVIEKRLGRRLAVGEIVHHIDGDRSNNADGNLYLCRDRAHHQEVENQLKETFRAMLKAGKVTFSQALGVYACH